MAVRAPPFRAEHLGSLLRPSDLLEKRHEVDDGKAQASELSPIEDKAVKDVVQLQKECGFHAVSDGVGIPTTHVLGYDKQARFSKFRAKSIVDLKGTFFESMNGIEEIPTGSQEGYDTSIFRAYAPDVAIFLKDKHIPHVITICTSKISHPGKSSFASELEAMKSLVSPEKIKLTIISPSWYHFRYGAGKAYPKDVYANDEEYFADIAKAYQQELDILYKAGIRNIQIDDPNLAYFCSEAMLKGWAEDKGNDKSADEMFDAYMKFYSACFERPADMHLGIHLCRGNYMGSRHFSEGAYDKIAKKLFQDLNVNTYYLEYDTPRAGGFEPLKYLPKDKNVVLGVVTSKFPKLEDQQEMVDRVYKAADIIAEGSNQTREQALERISVSPQCGFASHSSGNSLEYEDMRKKLKLVRAIAEQIWPGQA